MQSGMEQESSVAASPFSSGAMRTAGTNHTDLGRKTEVSGNAKFDKK